MSEESRTTTVAYFADFSCPYSYAMEPAVRRLAGQAAVRVDLRALELHPRPAQLPAEPGPPGWREAVAPLLERERRPLGNPPSPPRTAKAHEMARFAEAQGVGWEMRSAIFDAYFGAGRDIGRVDLLVELAEGVGLDATEAKVVVDIDRYTEAIAADREEAARLGIEGTPALVIVAGERAHLVPGALPYDDLSALIAELRRETSA
jgi:predicted DsbA family dithiol-disulfide isomerase